MFGGIEVKRLLGPQLFGHLSRHQPAGIIRTGFERAQPLGRSTIKIYDRQVNQTQTAAFVVGPNR